MGVITTFAAMQHARHATAPIAMPAMAPLRVVLRLYTSDAGSTKLNVAMIAINCVVTALVYKPVAKALAN